jgi:hypothetical protein
MLPFSVRPVQNVAVAGRAEPKWPQPDLRPLPLWHLCKIGQTWSAPRTQGVGPQTRAVHDVETLGGRSSRRPARSSRLSLWHRRKARDAALSPLHGEHGQHSVGEPWSNFWWFGAKPAAPLRPVSSRQSFILSTFTGPPPAARLAVTYATVQRASNVRRLVMPSKNEG